MRRSLLVIAPLALGFALAGCQQEAKAPDAAASSAPEAKPGLAMRGGALVLPAVKGNPGVAYFRLDNGSKAKVALAAVSVDGVDKAEMHQTKGGSMAPVDQVEIEPGGSANFAPGGYHVMLFGLDPKLVPGSSTEATLTFADGDKVSGQLSIAGAGDAAMGGMDMGAKH